MFAGRECWTLEDRFSAFISQLTVLFPNLVHSVQKLTTTLSKSRPGDCLTPFLRWTTENKSKECLPRFYELPTELQIAIVGFIQAVRHLTGPTTVEEFLARLEKHPSFHKLDISVRQKLAALGGNSHGIGKIETNSDEGGSEVPGWFWKACYVSGKAPKLKRGVVERDEKAVESRPRKRVKVQEKCNGVAERGEERNLEPGTPDHMDIQRLETNSSYTQNGVDIQEIEQEGVAGKATVTDQQESEIVEKFRRICESIESEVASNGEASPQVVQELQTLLATENVPEQAINRFERLLESDAVLSVLCGEFSSPACAFTACRAFLKTCLSRRLIRPGTNRLSKSMRSRLFDFAANQPSAFLEGIIHPLVESSDLNPGLRQVLGTAVKTHFTTEARLTTLRYVCECLNWTEGHLVLLQSMLDSEPDWGTDVLEMVVRKLGDLAGNTDIAKTRNFVQVLQVLVKKHGAKISEMKQELACIVGKTESFYTAAILRSVQAL